MGLEHQLPQPEFPPPHHPLALPIEDSTDHLSGLAKPGPLHARGLTHPCVRSPAIQVDGKKELGLGHPTLPSQDNPTAADHESSLTSLPPATTQAVREGGQERTQKTPVSILCFWGRTKLPLEQTSELLCSTLNKTSGAPSQPPRSGIEESPIHKGLEGLDPVQKIRVGHPPPRGPRIGALEGITVRQKRGSQGSPLQSSLPVPLDEQPPKPRGKGQPGEDLSIWGWGTTLQSSQPHQKGEGTLESLRPGRLEPGEGCWIPLPPAGQLEDRTREIQTLYRWLLTRRTAPVLVCTPEPQAQPWALAARPACTLIR